MSAGEQRPTPGVQPDITVIGTGRMAATIGAACAAAGLATVIVGRSLERAESAIEAARPALERRARRGHVRGRIDEAAARLIPATEVPEGSSGLVEAVIEDVAVKRAVLDQARRRASDAWLASTTSSIPLDALGPGVALAHFAYPADAVPIVEVAFDEGGSHRAAVLGWLDVLGKRPVEVVSGPGYVVSRLLFAYVFAGLALYDEGFGATAIDAAARDGGFPLGPMAIFDEGGLDLAQVVAGRVLAPAYGSRFAVPATVEALVEAGRIGRRVGNGFYRWGDGHPVEGPRPAGSRRERSATRADLDRMAIDLEAAIVDEASRLVDEGVAAPADIDLLAVGCARIFPVELTGPCARRARWGAA